MRGWFRQLRETKLGKIGLGVLGIPWVLKAWDVFVWLVDLPGRSQQVVRWAHELPKISFPSWLSLVISLGGLCLLWWDSKRRHRTPAAAGSGHAKPLHTPSLDVHSDQIPTARGEAQRRLKMIFKSSPVFTPEQKERITNLFSDFCDYLSTLGFSVPKEVPPLGASVGTSMTFVHPGTTYDSTILLPQDELDDRERVLASYSLYLFNKIFPPGGDWEQFRMQTVWMFADYFRWSFLEKPLINQQSKTARLMNALWGFRQQFGRDFMDQAMFYTVARWSKPTSTDTDFEKFFATRFFIGQSVVDNMGAQADHIRNVFVGVRLF
jgi:hypothetical protein